MPACSAFGCNNRPEKKVPGISFFRFPKNEYLRNKWIKACKRKNWLPSKISILCSEHFKEIDIDRTSLCSVRLKKNAVPCFFKGFPPYYQNLEADAENSFSQRVQRERLKSELPTSHTTAPLIIFACQNSKSLAPSANGQQENTIETILVESDRSSSRDNVADGTISATIEDFSTTESAYNVADDTISVNIRDFYSTDAEDDVAKDAFSVTVGDFSTSESDDDVESVEDLSSIESTNNDKGCQVNIKVSHRSKSSNTHFKGLWSTSYTCCYCGR